MLFVLCIVIYSYNADQQNAPLLNLIYFFYNIFYI